jgi:putative oxidoreductase
MDRTERAREWVDTHRDVLLDMLRIYIGVGILLKGIFWMTNPAPLVETMRLAHLPFTSVALAHYIAIAHFGGGTCLVFGLMTRVAAALQIPILVGAIVFVHMREGLFTSSQNLEFVLLTLAVLVVLTIHGGGRLSVDNRARFAHAHAAHAHTHAHA